MNSINPPLTMIKPDARYAIIGLGATGVSCARFLRERVDSLVMIDTRSKPPNVEQVRREFQGIDLLLGELNSEVLSDLDFLLVSPGVALEEPPIANAINSGVELLSDLDLFRQQTHCPIVCVTGSNGKSTVATLVQEMAINSGRRSVLCGNIGLPVLDALSDTADLYIVEVSSFQLERSRPLMAAAATVLNVSPDHMDRYTSFDDYVLAKAQVYSGAQNCIFNRQDRATLPTSAVKVSSFGMDEAANDDFGIVRTEGDRFFQQGARTLLNAANMRMKGSHNEQNALAALAIADALHLDMDVCCETIREFAGLAHRCEFVATIRGVDYINDSKGTNTGATIAALEGLAVENAKNIILIAGGVGKDADFSILIDAAKNAVKKAILFGQDAQVLADALGAFTKVEIVDSLEHAIANASDSGVPGDTVLLSPACASFDMFRGFEHRGDCFKACVNALASKEAVQ